MRRPRVGLLKGRLHDKVTLPILQQLGTKVCSTVDRVQTDSCELMFVKPRDVLSLLLHGVIDLGVVPDEWILEARYTCGTDALFVYGFARIGVVDLAWLHRGQEELQSALQECRFVASSFPAVARAALRARKLVRPVLAVSGSVEAIVASLGLVGLDVVESGATAQAHGLVVEPVARTRGVGIVGRANGGQWEQMAEALGEILGVDRGD